MVQGRELSDCILKLKLNLGGGPEQFFFWDLSTISMTWSTNPSFHGLPLLLIRHGRLIPLV